MGKIFTKLDLLKAYFHIPVAVERRQKTALLYVRPRPLYRNTNNSAILLIRQNQEKAPSKNSILQSTHWANSGDKYSAIKFSTLGLESCLVMCLIISRVN